MPGLVGREAAQRSSAVVLAGRTGRWLRIGDVSRDETGVSRADARADTAPRVDLDPATVFRAMAALAIGMENSLVSGQEPYRLSVTISIKSFLVRLCRQ